MNPKIQLAKTALGHLAQFGSGTIVYGIIKNNVTTTTTFQKVTVGVASFALGGVVAGIAKSGMDEIVDDAVKSFTDSTESV